MTTSEVAVSKGYDVEAAVTIAAPADRVWLWTVEDVDRERSWRNIDGKGVQTLERLDAGPLDVGSRFRGTVKVGPGAPQAYVNVVTQLEPGRSISWETTEAEGALLGRGTYAMVPVDGGTRFEIFLDYPPRTFVGRLQRPVVRLVSRRWVIPRMLDRLRTLVEDDQAA